MGIELKVSFDDSEIIPEQDFREDVCRCIQRTLESEEFPYDAQVELNWVSKERIQEANLELRGVDRVTDVLSVPFLELGEDGVLYIDDGDFYEGAVQLGEIILCYDRAKEQAVEFGHSLLREVCFLAVHSTLHLLGYDHELGGEEEKEMFGKQEAVLESLRILR